MSSFAAYLRLDATEGPGLPQNVARQLETAVAVGLLSHGDRLPPESELAAELGISTGTLRQALETLRQRGVIETRRGRGGGSFVRTASQPPPEAVKKRLRERSADSLRDLGDACAAVVGGAAHLAAQRAVGEDVEHLRSLAEQFRLAETADERRRADSRFHIEIGVIAHSARLTQAIVHLHDELASLFWMVGGEAGHHPVTESAHAALITAVDGADADAARDVVMRNVEGRVQHLLDLHLDLAVRGEPG
ncbi:MULTISPECIES: FadR/GntR family transcriptional regulator [Prauserella salsuginis group]|uniref:FadR/GntR family transcriptional regulator n=1 Tax=Prauserella salsuginis TaxID=387889 RepID=A0ABW6GBG2_9PSEU|nr:MULTISPECIES: FCD domain-containing protein [Prauserella salsuginis group]MCR3722899.1 DNA-binding transcriptional regulator, FadR family [Prauserella flava]MCR3737426.1 DNA-binding transcriptional regulator, FadR family [Prauserella salsuginis]